MQTNRSILFPPLSLPAGTAVLLLALLPAGRAGAADIPTGEQIFQKQCASCHGAHGEGTPDDYPHPLAGERSVAQLTRLIAKSMPKDDPGTCTGESAEKVAAYIYDAFYSKVARERNKPPRVELSRLTVRQYRNAVADLVASFRPAGKWDEQRGLRGDYFAGRGFRGGKGTLQRIDPQVRFDFGTEAPQADKFDASQFAIRWEGSVLAPETGTYEFIVRTEHAARLWVNDTRQPLIDAWVRSGNDTEHRASLALLAGRAYPLRLEFSKAKQGVDDKKKGQPVKPVKASIVLEWKPPQGGAEPIPARDLSPNRFPETFVVETAFPPDDRSLGWERGTTISKEWDQAATEAALEAAGYVVTHLTDLSGVSDGAKDREAKLREFCRQFVERAFRRPLTDEQKQRYIDHPFKTARDPEGAVKRVVLLALLSPRFLYREVDGGSDAYDVAARLAFELWDSLPDKELLDAAAAGRLTKPEQVSAQAERMLADPRAHAKLHEFFLQWLKIDPAPDLAKDPARFPGFDPTIIADLRTSLDLFLEDTVWGGDSDFRRLLLADDLYLNGRLAKFYGASLPADAPFQKVKLDGGRRAGVLTHPYLMAAFSYTGATSPIHRGVFLTRNVLGVTLRPPPEAFTPLSESLHPSLTTRERVMLQTKPASCQVCHGIVNPLGFTLEHFDAVGRYRAQDNGRPVDDSGTYHTRAGQTVKFAGARDLAKFLADSEEVQTAFAERLFHHLVKQPVRAYGPRRLTELREFFCRNGFSIRKLVVQEATVAALVPSSPGVATPGLKTAK